MSNLLRYVLPLPVEPKGDRAAHTLRRLGLAAIVCFLSLQLAACGGDQSTEPDRILTETIGPDGGVVSSDDGSVTLVFPPGALAEVITVTITSTSGFPVNSRVVGSTVYEFEPSGQSFAQPVELRVAYEPSRVPTGIGEDELRLNKVVAGAWEEVPGSAPQTGDQVVTGFIDSFSVFGVLGVPVASVTVTPDSATVLAGFTTQLTAVAADTTGAPLGGRSISWSSSDTNIASVDLAGLVTALVGGSATITASSEGHIGNAGITVLATPNDVTTPVPIIDMGSHTTYYGFPGGLYPDGSNVAPAAHVAARPNVDTGRRYVFMSVSMSNGRQEFCKPGNGSVGPQDCTSHSFVGQASADPAIHDSLVIVNAAQGGRPANSWDSPDETTYDVADSELEIFGMAPTDVQIVWIKQAHAGPRTSLPDSAAAAFKLVGLFGRIARAIKVRYPNVKQAYLSSRIWSCAVAGGDEPLNPEPFAYETGYAVKWVIEAQIRQLETGDVDPLAGNLSLDVAPWLAWGAYLWADGQNPRSDGLSWSPSDLLDDCTHPSAAGEEKVGSLLLNFFKSSPLTADWFLK